MRSLTCLIVCLLLSAPAAAQEQRGSIEGIVKDCISLSTDNDSGLLSTVNDAPLERYRLT